MAAAVRGFGLLAALAALLGGAALAHATLVFGTLSSAPPAPRPGEPFTLRLELADPTGTPVEDAYVLAEFRRQEDDEPVSARLEEGEVPGRYQASLALPQPGSYQLLLRDQTFRQEEARAELEVTLGDGPLFPEGKDAIVFPPTATGPANLGTWLIWLIAVPLAAGVVVTVLVLRRPSAGDEAPS